jgi:hypothetical protein
MKTIIAILISLQVMVAISPKLFSQTTTLLKEVGIDAGGLTNFPANQNYLTENMSMLYIAPYLRTGKHEFSVGIVYPLTTHGIYFNDNNISSRPGIIAGYKFYIFDVEGRENMFIHYSFQYLKYKGSYDIYYHESTQPYHYVETDMYINNVIGLGYNLFFDTNERFGLYYILDYVVSQAGYKLGSSGLNENSWATKYIWNNISTHFGLSIKLSSLKKKDSKQNNKNNNQ